ncbi:hypothetical protein TrVE_jg2454 [Triparma verrucosa]|uniref:Fe2OG dioxygenase domain-containing protein n=1 Tax=Triparma verrucosa TaxID=1606542 RepID=A0A9W7C251_9STRA|nr:hypothetical protein TrVE_jg2454 [Triparma verrucosa]
MRKSIHSTCFLLVLGLQSSLSLSFPHNPAPSLRDASPPPQQSSSWAAAAEALSDPGCCVVSVGGLDSHLRALQEWFVDKGPDDLDLRKRVRVHNQSLHDCHELCLAVCNAGVNPHATVSASDPATAALEELARGVSSLATSALEGGDCDPGIAKDVFLRVVCASDYKARDPMFHTDKAPLRGYVTLTGLGTEYMTRPSSALDYLQLRALGSGAPLHDMQRAHELEFIVMKGDHWYEAHIPPGLRETVWQRNRAACVHRSPPAATTGSEVKRRRVIVSLDLATGDDDREWYDADMKRSWRSGMTQRKSRLVA